MEEDPSTTTGTVRIMAALQKYIPWTPAGKPHVTPCHGDGGCVINMCAAQKTRMADISNDECLLGLEPTPQEFHHRALIMQV